MSNNKIIQLVLFGINQALDRQPTYSAAIESPLAKDVEPIYIHKLSLSLYCLS